MKLLSEKGSLPQWKENFGWQKGTCVIQKGTWSSNTPFIESCIWLKKRVFFVKKGTFNEASDLK